ncbi:MAG: hypothetical protein R3B65_02980 [Candidatus Paceibacterota bacterium]
MEVENIEPTDGSLHQQRADRGRLDQRWKATSFGPITLVTRVDDTLSIYTADTIGFPLANADYQMRSKGELYNVHLGRLKAIAIQSAEDESWIVFGKNAISKNNDTPLIGSSPPTTSSEKPRSFKSSWNTRDGCRHSGQRQECQGTMSVVGPWPWKRHYGSFELSRAEREDEVNKTIVYEPNPEVGMLFQLTKDGGHLYKGKKFKKLAISKETKGFVTGTITIKHKKKAKP